MAMQANEEVRAGPVLTGATAIGRALWNLSGKTILRYYAAGKLPECFKTNPAAPNSPLKLPRDAIPRVRARLSGQVA